MSEHQFDNPFFQAGKLAAASGETREDCPYDYLQVEEKEVPVEHYRQKEWLAGFNSYKESSDNE